MVSENRKEKMWRHVTMAVEFLDLSNGELKQRQQRRQRKRRKSNKFMLAKQHLARASRIMYIS